MIEPKLSGEFGTLMGWADSVRKLGIRVNADTPEDARTAIKFGGEGIGLCRTEHMFFEETRIRTVREMILAEDEQARRAALSKLLPMQRADFVELFEIMKGLPVTIRLLDPPLHEFLPHTQAEIEEVARAMNTDPRRLADRARELAEFNPMLGFRGCRLVIAYPEIAEMQSRAIFEAAVEAGKRTGKAVGLEVMVPLIATKAEFDLIKARIDATAQSVMKETGAKLSYQVGTMIELPRACLMAGEIATTAEFFSFGTNDLTQTTYGISRDRQGDPGGRSVHFGRSRRRRRAGEAWRPARPQDPPGYQGRDLWRAWRRSRFRRVLPRDRPRLRLLLALPRADRAAGRRAGRARQNSRQPGVSSISHSGARAGERARNP
jgi:pyruvate,orthophosphate dikinase